MKIKILGILITAATIVCSQSYQISKESLLEKVRILTSPEMDGRLPGSEGYEKAVNYAESIFRDLGLSPLDDNTYHQTLYVEYNNIIPPAAFRIEGEVTKEYVLGSDYIFRGFTGSGSFTAPVAFRGYGLNDARYNDYKGVNTEGKIVIAFKNNPSWKIDEKPFINSYPREKAEAAAEHGAIAILYVSLPNDAAPQKLIGSVLHGAGDQNEKFPQLQISIEAADDLLAGSGYTLKDLQTLIDSMKTPHSIDLKSMAHITATAEYTHASPVRNAAAILEGNHPQLKDEYIVIGAHLDHVGSQAGYVFPGANDNASGSAGVLELAEYFVKNNIKTDRSILFVLFASEEQGLFGAEHFVENSPVPLESITAMINLDCIGYGDSIRIGNGKSAPELWNLIRDLDKKNFNMMVESTWAGGGADATPFHNAGIPSAYFVTTNSYDHLHLASDTAETLNGELFEKMVKLALLTLKKISSEDYTRELIAK